MTTGLVLGGLAPATAHADAATDSAATAGNHDRVVFERECPEASGDTSPSTPARFFVASSDDASDQQLVAIGPHGSAIAPTLDRVAYTRVSAGQADVVVRSGHGGPEQVVATLPSSADTGVLRWSADATTLLVRDAGLLYLVGVAGAGAPEPLLTADQAASLQPSIAEFAFDSHDTVITVSGARDNINGLYRLHAGSEPVVLSPGTYNSSKTFPISSLDPAAQAGAYLLAQGAAVHHVTDYPTGSWTTIDTGSTTRHVAAWIGQARYSADQRWVYYTGSGIDGQAALHRVPVDGSARPELLMQAAGYCLRLVRTLPGSARDLGAPQRLAVTLDGAHNVLQWQAPVAGAASYRVERLDGEDPDPATSRIRYAGTATTFRDTVVVGQPSTYIVTAIGTDGQPHGSVRAVAVATSLPLTAPQLASDSSVDGGRIPLRWGSDGNALDTRYTLPGTGIGVLWGPVRSATADCRKPGTTFLALRGADRFDNVSVTARATIVTPADERAGRFSAGWTRAAATGAWHGTLTSTTQAGASASFSFVTTQRAAAGRPIWLIGASGPQQGKLAVYLDGRRVALVDARAARVHLRAHLWAGRGWVAPGRHTLRVVALGTAGRPRVSLDAVGAAA